MEFDRCLSKLLGTRRHTPWFDTKRREIHVEASSVLLHSFLTRPWRRLKPWISNSKECVSMFLRGFFDSECCVSKVGYVTCFNADFGLLEYVQHLLFSFFNIESSGPHIKTRAGTTISNRGRSYVRQQNCYYIHVRAHSLGAFYRHVGLTILRKKIRLETRLRVYLRKQR